MNRNFLAIDCGNSRIKATLIEESDKICGRRIFAYEDIDALIEWVEALHLAGAAMASVHSLDTRLIESIRKVMGESFLLITPHTEIGIRINYADPARLGIDRKVAAVGASVLYPHTKVMIIDAGTAVTKDMIGADGGFDGGAISPGIHLRFQSLSNGTYLLPCPELPEDISGIEGDSTEGCILRGVLGGLLDEIGMAIKRGKDNGAERVIISGGDGEWIYRNLERWCGNLTMEYQYAADLLAIGMREIYIRQS